jgi:hypothetical protein
MTVANVLTEVAVFGRSVRRTVVINTDGATIKDPLLPAAKTGALTTRTNNTDGTLTMDAGHGIATSNRLDLYWTNPDGTIGRRVGVTVGTVATNSVPITGGSGANLPANNTAVRAMVPQLETFNVPSTSDMLGLFASSESAASTAVFRASGSTVLLTAQMTPNTGYIWESTSGVTNPFASACVEVFLSHDDATAAREVAAVAMIN